MSVAPRTDPLETVCAEVARLNRLSFSLLPLGGGKDGKTPSVASWGQKSHVPIRTTIGIMRGRSVLAYGVRLKGLAVLDLDEDSEELVGALEARFGPSPVHVQTPRGYHLYYKLHGPAPNLRREGLPVDVKTGMNAYVAGPHSIRADGGAYIPIRGQLGETPLPNLMSATLAQSTGDVGAMAEAEPIVPEQALSNSKVPQGERHNYLVSKATNLARTASSEKELIESLARIGEQNFESVSDMMEKEIPDLAAYYWKLRMQNRLFAGRDSGFWFDRVAIDALKTQPYYTEALGLYVLLLDQHGHIEGKTFVLAFDGMKAAGHTNLGKPRFKRAIQTLEQAGLIRLAKNYSKGRHKKQYQLASPKTASLRENREREEKGYTYIC